MRHRSKTVKLKRTASHRKALLANLACSLIEHGRIKTTFGKAKALRPVAEKLVTLAKRDDLHSRRLAIAFLLGRKDIVQKLFSETAPASKDRQGGYCRITKLGARMSDSAPMAIIEWVDQPVAEEAPAVEVEAKEEETPAPKKAAKKAAPKKAADEVVEVAGE